MDEAGERLADELRRTLSGGGLTDPKALPYLQACLRESHRLTPSLPAGLPKQLTVCAA